MSKVISDIYKQVKEDIKKGTKVLFIGVPCQVAGLLSYLGKEYENLFTVDLVCHGTPSQQLLNDNLKHYGIKDNAYKVCFRRKKVSSLFKSTKCRIEFGLFLMKKNIFVLERSLYKDSYSLGFLTGLYYRESCYSCKYATGCRISDMTVSDFWGLSNDAGFDQGEGVSNILINTKKAEILFAEIKERLRYVKRDRVEAIIGNAQLQRPMKRHPNFYKFRKLYPQYGFVKSVKKCTKMDRVKNEVFIPIFNLIKSILSKM